MRQHYTKSCSEVALSTAPTTTTHPWVIAPRSLTSRRTLLKRCFSPRSLVTAATTITVPNSASPRITSRSTTMTTSVSSTTPAQRPDALIVFLRVRNPTSTEHGCTVGTDGVTERMLDLGSRM